MSCRSCEIDSVVACDLAILRPGGDVVKFRQGLLITVVLRKLALTHVLAVGALPFHHKDPFDRLLIAQSIEEDLTLVSADSQFSADAVKLLQ